MLLLCGLLGACGPKADGAGESADATDTDTDTSGDPATGTDDQGDGSGEDSSSTGGDVDSGSAADCAPWEVPSEYGETVTFRLVNGLDHTIFVQGVDGICGHRVVGIWRGESEVVATSPCSAPCHAVVESGDYAFPCSEGCASNVPHLMLEPGAEHSVTWKGNDNRTSEVPEACVPEAPNATDGWGPGPVPCIHVEPAPADEYRAVASYTTTAQCSYEPECACPDQDDSACLVWPTEVGEIEATAEVTFAYPEEAAIDIYFEP